MKPKTGSWEDQKDGKTLAKLKGVGGRGDTITKIRIKRGGTTIDYRNCQDCRWYYNEQLYVHNGSKT